MIIEVKTFATLRRLAPSVPEMEVEEGVPVRSVLALLGIPEEKIAIIFINNIHGSLDSVLKEGDSLGLFPPIGGG